jgi:eukaryotic-like serine/threonine-protein kinase
MARQPPIRASRPEAEHAKGASEREHRTESGMRPRVWASSQQSARRAVEDPPTIEPGLRRATRSPFRDPLLGRVIHGKFKVLAPIARGGMSMVYRAEQQPLGRLCALKVLEVSATGKHDPVLHKRFLLEASMMSKLRHPNTATIFDFGETDDAICYIAMEYLCGQTLHSAIQQVGFFSEYRAVRVARQICRSLREAHSLGIVHRDLKPANVFLLNDADELDFVKVLDFGLVKDISPNHREDLTRAGIFLGTPKYMAPEQVQHRIVGPSTDVYALGVVMYEMVTGRTPFDRSTTLEVLRAHAHEPVPPIAKMNPAARVSAGMEETIARAMARDPLERYASMGELLAALNELDPAPVSERAPAGAARSTAWRRRRSMYVALWVAAVGWAVFFASLFCAHRR